MRKISPAAHCEGSSGFCSDTVLSRCFIPPACKQAIKRRKICFVLSADPRSPKAADSAPNAVPRREARQQELHPRRARHPSRQRPMYSRGPLTASSRELPTGSSPELRMARHPTGSSRQSITISPARMASSPEPRTDSPEHRISSGLTASSSIR